MSSTFSVLQCVGVTVIAPESFGLVAENLLDSILLVILFYLVNYLYYRSLRWELWETHTFDSVDVLVTYKRKTQIHRTNMGDFIYNGIFIFKCLYLYTFLNNF